MQGLKKWMTKFLIYKINNRSFDWRPNADDKSCKPFRRSISKFLIEYHKIKLLVSFGIVGWESLLILQ